MVSSAQGRQTLEITGKHELIRQNDGFVPETVILVGNGVVENGWAPLEEALDEMTLAMDDYPIHPRKLGKIESLSYLAMKQRWASQQIMHKTASVAVCAATDFEEMHSAFWMMQNICQPFRKTLAELYENGQGLVLKDNAIKALVEHGLEEEMTGVINISWDNLLWDYNDQILSNIIHLHGRCSSWETMLLPGETAEENAHYMLMAKDLESHIRLSKEITENAKMGAIQLLRSAFMPPVNESEYWSHHAVHQSYAHGRALKWIREAHKLVICGLNFNAYDHEILSIVSDKKVSDSPEKWEQVVIINNAEDNWDKVSGLLKVEPELCTKVNPDGWWEQITSFVK